MFAQLKVLYTLLLLLLMIHLPVLVFGAVTVAFAFKTLNTQNTQYLFSNSSILMTTIILIIR